MRPADVSIERFDLEPLVGRERESAALLALLAESASGSGARAALVTGPPGIGKSRLAREIGRLAVERGAAVWTAEGDPDGRPATFGVLGDLLHRLAQVAPGEALETRRAKLRERLGKHVNPRALWETTTVLGEAIGTSFLDVSADTGSRLSTGSVLLADLTLRAWEELLAAELAQGPLVLVIDDAQWADLPSMRLLDAALRNLAEHPLLVIALGRPELRAAFPGLFVERAALELRLGEPAEPSARERSSTPARDRTPPAVLDPAILAWQFEQARAPAQAIEPYRMAALRALAANDFETAIGHAARAEACGAEGTTLGELARILADAHLWRGETAPAEREARRAMALLTPGTVPWLQAATAYAIAASRLGNGDALYAATRDVEALVASRPSSSVEPALRVAQVTAMARLAIALVYAGDVPAAEPMLGRMHAWRTAGALDALPFALGFAHRAHAIRAHLRGELFPAFLAFDAAAASFERAGALRDACVDHANAGFMLTELGQNTEAEERLASALATAKRLALPTVTANAQLNLCLLLARRGATFPAAATGETALATYEKQGSPRMIAIALVYVARALLAGGAAAAAQQRARRATDFADDVPPYRAYAFATLSAAERAMGRAAEAVTAAETAMAALRDVGAEEGEAYVRLAFVEALQAAGRPDEARTALAGADAALSTRAALIADRAHREAFLQNIPEHARTVDLAEGVGVGAVSRARTLMAIKLVPDE